MPTVLAETLETEVRDGQVINEMVVSARTETGARQRFNATARFKGLSNFEVQDIELEEENPLGSPNVYTAVVVSER